MPTVRKYRWNGINGHLSRCEHQEPSSVPYNAFCVYGCPGRLRDRCVFRVEAVDNEMCRAHDIPVGDIEDTGTVVAPDTPPPSPERQRDAVDNLERIMGLPGLTERARMALVERLLLRPTQESLPASVIEEIMRGTRSTTSPVREYADAIVRSRGLPAITNTTPNPSGAEPFAVGDRVRRTDRGTVGPQAGSLGNIMAIEVRASGYRYVVQWDGVTSPYQYATPEYLERVPTARVDDPPHDLTDSIIDGIRSMTSNIASQIRDMRTEGQDTGDFAVGDRVRRTSHENAPGTELIPTGTSGTILAIVNEGRGPYYRIEWDNGYGHPISYIDTRVFERITPAQATPSGTPTQETEVFAETDAEYIHAHRAIQVENNLWRYCGYCHTMYSYEGGYFDAYVETECQVCGRKYERREVAYAELSEFDPSACPDEDTETEAPARRLRFVGEER